MLLFSATFPDNVMKYADAFAPSANKLRLKEKQLSVSGISQFFIDCNGEAAKYDVVVKLYGLMNIGSSVIFCKVRYKALRKHLKYYQG